MKDYYQILNLDRKANLEEIKKAYRLYASKFHPDKHQGDKFFEEKFKEILEAYEILSNQDKRNIYDRQLFGNQSKNDQNFEQNTQKEERTNNYQENEPKSQTKATNTNAYQTQRGTTNVNKETPVKNFGKVVFWGGILGSFLFLFGGEDTIMVYVTLINIGFWCGGIIWLIGSKLNI